MFATHLAKQDAATQMQKEESPSVKCCGLDTSTALRHGGRRKQRLKCLKNTLSDQDGFCGLPPRVGSKAAGWAGVSVDLLRPFPQLNASQNFKTTQKRFAQIPFECFQGNAEQTRSQGLNGHLPAELGCPTLVPLTAARDLDLCRVWERAEMPEPDHERGWPQPRG